MSYITIVFGFFFNTAITIIFTVCFLCFLLKTNLKMDISIFLLLAFYQIYFILNFSNWVVLYQKNDVRDNSIAEINKGFYLLDNTILYLIVLCETYFVI